MIVKKATGSVFPVNTTYISAKGLLDIFIPKTTTSQRWKNWKATIDFKTCAKCLDRHGTIYPMDAFISEPPPHHDYCRCVVEQMDAIEHGGATRDGEKGADYTLFTQGSLPEYYIS